MNATLHAKEILDIIDDVKPRQRVKAMNLCLNGFFDSVSEELSVGVEKFKAPDVFYEQLEESVRGMISAADTEDREGFQKNITSLRFLLNMPAPRPSIQEELTEEKPQ